MSAAWQFTACTCRWDAYESTCSKPQHVVFALRDRHDPKLPLIMSSPCPDAIPAWMTEAAS